MQTEIDVLEQYSNPQDRKKYTFPQAETDRFRLASADARNPNGSRSDIDQAAANCFYGETHTNQLFGIHSKKVPSHLENEKEVILNNGVVYSNDTTPVNSIEFRHIQKGGPVHCNGHAARHPSPYYYGDLYKVTKKLSKFQPPKYRKSVNLDVSAERAQIPKLSKRNSIAGDHISPPTLFGNQDPVTPAGSGYVPSVRSTEIISSCIITEWDETLMPPRRLLSHDLPTIACKYIPFAKVKNEVGVVRGTVRRLSKLRTTRRIGLKQPLECEAEADRAGNEADIEEEVVGEGDNIADEKMARQRHVYETAFDCKVERSEDNSDDVYRVTNSNSKDINRPCAVAQITERSTKHESERKVQLRSQPLFIQMESHSSVDMSSLSQGIESLQIKCSDEKIRLGRTVTCEYSPSALSNNFLAAKFHDTKDHIRSNIRKAPNIHLQSDSLKLKHIGSTRKSWKMKQSKQINDGIFQNKNEARSSVYEITDSRLRGENRENIVGFGSRPRQERHCSHYFVPNWKTMVNFKGRAHKIKENSSKSAKEPKSMQFKLHSTRRRLDSSSMESMATSSSGGSMESLRSSTSEDNRSTSSSESRHSISLSSHSSDSGSTNWFYQHRYHPQTSLSNFLAYHDSKLHILSPISDKSSQEPASENSDSNRNCNSQQASPEKTMGNSTASSTANVSSFKVIPPINTSFNKGRLLPNKHLISLALQSSSSGDAEIQGSDSGISIESQGAFVSQPVGVRSAIPQMGKINSMSTDPDLSDLPFDMPKLRRRRLLIEQDATTSGSATSVDFRDLPFDMPKLRRRLRSTQTTDSSASRASSSLSIRDTETPVVFVNQQKQNSCELW
ncbi:uncharacterized protein [Fopius arisanus]|uniref:Uncharacterized protein n=1 Tax=Fopius arisanus TaxID=64838 RepID=A0A9R1TL22_9HYME|nr:PREDICTED: uncharacterized protein LOC105272326 [Fopius arisanus]